MACKALSGVTGVEQIWSLPTGGTPYSVLSSLLTAPLVSREFPTQNLERVLLRDRWGKRLLDYKLAGYQVVKLPGQGIPYGGLVCELEPGLELVRCRKEEGGLACYFSDGTELAVTGLIFADGYRSCGRTLMEKVAPVARDRRAVACWTFLHSNILSTSSWEFRTALGKSVELLPLPEDRLRVKLRFRAPVGARQTAAQLSDLFSEFGPDISALLEGVEDDEISAYSEESPSKIAFTPLPGTLALGPAAIGEPLLENFDWALRLSLRQLERVLESLVVGHWEPTAWEPASQQALEPLLRSERFFRDFLHYDNVLLRPLRDFALKLMPARTLEDRVQRRLSL